MNDTDLGGSRVLVTRPEHQAQALVAAIEAANGVAVTFPVIEIRPRDRAGIESDLGHLPDPDITIFISANAVTHGSAYAGNALIAAVGPATAAAIESAGLRVDIRPDSGYDSESLLAEPALQDVEGRTIRIIRGSGGREFLGTTLLGRAASVHYLEVYSRGIPDVADREIAALAERFEAGDIDVFTIMSVQSLKNLLGLLPATCISALTATPLVTPAARVIKEALDLLPGSQATQAAGPGAEEMVRAIASVTAPGPQTSGPNS